MAAQSGREGGSQGGGASVHVSGSTSGQGGRRVGRSGGGGRRRRGVAARVERIGEWGLGGRIACARIGLGFHLGRPLYTNAVVKKRTNGIRCETRSNGR
jgi:hypothetical protein